jgi:serine/threonine protein kinase
MKVYVDNKEYNLNEQNAISGGEGSVYLEGDIAFKIYHKKETMIPIGKFNELNQIKNNRVIKPENLIYNSNKEMIGYTMKSIYNTVQLSRVITADYQKNNNINHDDLVSIMIQIKDILTDIHKHNCLVVDINDANILIDNDLKVYFIDVDSYKTPNYPATALQDYARDFKIENNNFTHLSDWFSFALLSSKLLIGIHPFMGRWNKFKKRDKENALSYRSLNDISIFNNEVVFAKTVKSFSFIPKNYYLWFLDLFEKGQRTIPPIDTGEFFQTSESLILSSEIKVKFKKKFTLDRNINDFYQNFRNEVIFTENSVFFNNEHTSLSTGKKVVIFNEKDEPLIFKINGNKSIESYNLVTKKIETYNQLLAEDIFSFNNQLYIKYFDNFMNIDITYLNNKHLLSIKQNQTIMPYATLFFEKTVFQNTLGKAFFYLVEDKDTQPFVKIKELDGKNIINAKYSNKILSVVYQNNHSYTNIMIKFNNNFQEYELIYNENTDCSDINFTLNDKGVGVFIPNDYEIILFFNKWGLNDLRKINDKNIISEMRLFSNNANIELIIKKDIYQISLS